MTNKTSSTKKQRCCVCHGSGFFTTRGECKWCFGSGAEPDGERKTAESQPHEIWITTQSGRQFFPLSPREEDIDIADIAHHLSLINRFSGATREPYSVAEHSVRVSYLLPDNLALWGLLHDASEAYLLDMATPLKLNTNLGAEYQAVEQGIMRVICRKFGLTEEEPPEVKIADKRLLMTEKRDLLTNNTKHPSWGIDAEPLRDFIHPVNWRKAKIAFMERFTELTQNV